MNRKDIVNSDPAEGSRDVIVRAMKRHENHDADPPHERAKPSGKNQREESKPH